MRTRMYDSLNNREIAAYLARSDVIFLPVGVTEIHGEMPVNAEHVLALGAAKLLAEAADGLVLPGLAYFYAGATAMGTSTLEVSPSLGAAYLKEICRSLLRRGFRRQVLLTAHGPASVTVSVVVREFFNETRCPIAYVDLIKPISELNQKAPGKICFDKLIWGAYRVLERMDEIPQDQRPIQRAPYPEAFAKLQQKCSAAGFYYTDESQHGWWPEAPMSAADRAARAEEGERQLRELAAFMKPAELVEAMREADRLVSEVIVPKFGSRLP